MASFCDDKLGQVAWTLLWRFLHAGPTQVEDHRGLSVPDCQGVYSQLSLYIMLYIHITYDIWFIYIVCIYG